MIADSAAIPPTTGRHKPALMVAAVSLFALLLGLLALRPEAPRFAVAPAAAPPIASPLLILRPHVTHLVAVLGHGDVLRGALEPTLPGVNTVRVALRLPSGAAVEEVTLAAAMLGMAMPPSRAVLHRSPAGALTGTLRLPMFGEYHVAVSLRTTARCETGMFSLALPFPQH